MDNPTIVTGSYRINCGQIWGGIDGADLDVTTSGVAASLFCGVSEGRAGGDVYYFSVCDNDRLTRVAIADVRGHGVPVSRVSEWLYDALATHMNTLDGDAVLAELNRKALKHGLDAMSTAVVAGFYLEDSTLHFTYAGHPPALVCRRGQTNWQPVYVSGSTARANVPLGVFEDAVYEQGSARLEQGDRLFLYTDGLSEASDSSGTFFGDTLLLSVLNGQRHLSVTDLKRSVVDAVTLHCGGTLTQDDVTLMAIEVR